MDILRIYRMMFYSRITAAIQSFERKLGAPFDSVVTEIEVQLAEDGRVLGEKKSKNLSASTLKTLVTKILARDSLSPAWQLIQELESTKVPEAPVDTDQLNGVVIVAARSRTFRTSFRMDDEAEDNDDDQEDDIEGGADRSTGANSPWNWQRDIRLILRNINGLRKLSDLRTPSTASIGSQTILSALQIMTETANVPPLLEGKVFMGIKLSKKIPQSLKTTDDVHTINDQWNALRAAFTEQHSILLFHLTNHYAIIYALREYVSQDGLLVREILTARRGQRPNAWISFDEVRTILLKWSGYNIMKIHLSESAVLSEVQILKESINKAETDFDADKFLI
jgi:hypothetical protein